LVAKLITHADTRAGAIALMIEALDTMKLDGIITNAPLHRAIMADPEFITGGVDTNYLAGLLPRLAGVTP
jgi:acetyl-CoA carboxylase, biotin carboxylase subunit